MNTVPVPRLRWLVLRGGVSAIFLFHLALVDSVCAAPDPAALLAPVRMGSFSLFGEFAGTLRVGRDREAFRMEVADGSVTYHFADPDEKMRMEISAIGSRLLRWDGSLFRVVSLADLGDPVRGTDLTLEDISLWFLYWPDAVYDGEQIIGPRRTHKVRLRSPERESQYAAVNVWLDQETGTLLQADAYDWDGRIAKRFKVVSGQRFEGHWMLKEMRVETMNPSNGRVVSRTYLSIDHKL